jgi:UDP-glucose 4-epimerase
LEQARSGQPITVFGDGTQSRCFAAATEVAEALVALLATPAAHGRIVNVGSDREITMQALAELVQRLAASSSAIVHVPLAEVFPQGFVDPMRRVPSLDRLRAAIGWAPERPIEAIVNDLLAAPWGSLQTSVG